MRPHPAVRWLVFAAVLVLIGSTAGWLAGRWDAGSWVAQRYAYATEFIQSLATDPGGDRWQSSISAPSTRTEPASPNHGAAISSGEQAEAPIEAPQPTTVDPRPVTPPRRPEGSNTASLVPIKPSDTAEPPVSEPAPRPDPADARSEATTTQPAEPWSVLDVQRELARLGYYGGSLDGQVGPMTRGAVRAFQEANGLRPTGRIEPSLVNALSGRADAGTAAEAGRKSP